MKKLVPRILSQLCVAIGSIIFSFKTFKAEVICINKQLDGNWTENYFAANPGLLTGCMM
jgi:hypothetical protein